MNIFNSLGSNYNFGFVCKALFNGDNSNNAKLKNFLEDKYQGQAILVYKGREAIELALNLLNMRKGTQVAINGFTCYAVYKAIVNVGYKPEYIDIDNLDLNFSAQKLREKLKKEPNIKVLIIQNTLGYPCDIEKIVDVCKENKVILIEDLAHSIGTTYKNNQEVGTIGDFVMLSFSQDKMIDGISGGALIVRNEKYQVGGSLYLGELSNRQQRIDRFYPLFTYLIRTTYQTGIGKIIHLMLKRFNLLSNPMGNKGSSGLHKLPSWYCNLIYAKFKDLHSNLDHRKSIASIYAQRINPKILSKIIVEQVPDSTNLRFPVFVEDRINLIKYLKTYGIYVSDIWYDAPIAPKKYMSLTDYKNQSPEAEKVSDKILNLPTHQNVSKKQAEEISERINLWLKSH